MSYKTKLSNLLREARENLGLSQKDISEKFGWSTPQYVSNFERGLSLPPDREIEKICGLIKISPKEVYKLIYEIQKEKLDKKYKNKF